MNETQANQLLSELATDRSKGELSASDYRQQRRRILLQFTAPYELASDKTLEWHGQKSAARNTSEPPVLGDCDDTAELKIINYARNKNDHENKTHHYKVIGFAVLMLVILLLSWHNI